MYNDLYLTNIGMVLFVATLCVFIQKFFKKYLESDQYYYLKDITLIAAWALCGIWAPDGPLRVTIAAGVVAACVGFCQKVSRGKNLRFLYFFVGLGFSLLGPRIAFVEFSQGEYYYLSYFISIVISTLWLGIFPVFFQELDENPGMAGVLLTVSWTLISVVILFSSNNLLDASQVCLTGFIFLIVFWNRHVHPYRRLTEPLTALWGTLFAGISIFGVSKGITFYNLAFIPLGFFALPILETLLSVTSASFSVNPTGNFIFYRKLIKSNKDHIRSISVISRICCITAIIVAIIQANIYILFLLLISSIFILALIQVYFNLEYRVNLKEYNRRPQIWGIAIDNISLNYAITQVQHWITSKHAPSIIVTPDALAALRSRKDKKYRNIIKKAGLVLPDGVGLITALRILGNRVQERIPGCEFAEHLCKRAAFEGWGIWLLGGKPGVAQKAADTLAKKYPGIIITGTHDGYFKDEDSPEICKKISKSDTKIILIGLGVPKQEYWLDDWLYKTNAALGIGIGGTLDILAGNLRRAPEFWQKSGLEWLYRLKQEPWRWKRIIKLPLFVFFVFLTALHLDTYKNVD